MNGFDLRKTASSVSAKARAVLGGWAEFCSDRKPPKNEIGLGRPAFEKPELLAPVEREENGGAISSVATLAARPLRERKRSG